MPANMSNIADFIASRERAIEMGCKIAGVTVRGLSAWNGTTWVQLGGSNVTGFNYRSIYEHPSGDVYLGLSATATSWQGTTPPESCILVARQTLVAGPVEMASTTAWVACFLYTNSYFFAGGRNGVSTAITNSFAGCVTVTNPGSLDAYPTFFIQTSASGYLLSIENLTTGKRVTFNFFVLTTETITIVCDPTRLSITSSTRGNQLSGLAAGGSLADLVLQPGANLIAIRADRSNFSGWLQYPVLLEDPAEVMKLP